jgi:glycosyltransferase involved in cell wall biosynthesis
VVESAVLISIIVTSYNKGAFIQECLESVLNQTFREFEVIIVDDCSTDNTIDVLKSYLVNPKIKFLQLEVNKGANYCRNRGAELGKGLYLLFLDADDVLSLDCLTRRIQIIEKYPEADFIVFSMGTFYKRIGDSENVWIPKKEKAIERFLSHELPWAICQPLWKKESFIKLGGFDETFSRLQDVELHTRALFNNLTFEVCPSNYKPDCYYRINTSRITDVNLFVQNFSDGVCRYYAKFKNQAIEKNKMIFLFFSLVETSIYLETFIKKNKVSSQNKFYYRNLYLSLVKESKYKQFILKFIFLIYSALPFYPRGLKRFLKLIIQRW